MAATTVGVFRAAAVAASIWVTAPSAGAAEPLTASELADLFQSTTVRMDMALLPYLAAFPGSLSFNYAAAPGSADWASWSGALNGNYGAQKLFLSYADGALNLPAGTSSWSVAGTLGAGAVAGGGSVSILYPTDSTFDLTMNESLSFNGVAATADVTFSGTLLSPTHFMLGSPGDPGSGSGTLTVAGEKVVFPPPNCIDNCTFAYWTLFGGIILSAMTYDQNDHPYTIYDYYPPGTELVFSCNSPEPATWTMLIMGFAGIGLAGRRRARASAPRLRQRATTLLIKNSFSR
jgi:hypothetical protein